MALSTQYKVNQLAKDLEIKTKDIVDLMSGTGIEVKTQKSLTPEEFGVVINLLTKANQIDNIDEYLDGVTYIPSKIKETPKEEPKAEPAKEEPKAEPVKEAPKLEEKKEEKKPAAKVEPKPEVKAEPKVEKKPENNAPRRTSPWECPFCGHQNPIDARFCKSCGTEDIGV